MQASTAATSTGLLKNVYTRKPVAHPPAGVARRAFIRSAVIWGMSLATVNPSREKRVLSGGGQVRQQALSQASRLWRFGAERDGED